MPSTCHKSPPRRKCGNTAPAAASPNPPPQGTHAGRRRGSSCSAGRRGTGGKDGRAACMCAGASEPCRSADGALPCWHPGAADPGPRQKGRPIILNHFKTEKARLGSKMTTLLAPVRLSPVPPALVEMRKTKAESCEGRCGGNARAYASVHVCREHNTIGVRIYHRSFEVPDSSCFFLKTEETPTCMLNSSTNRCRSCGTGAQGTERRTPRHRGAAAAPPAAAPRRRRHPGSQRAETCEPAHRARPVTCCGVEPSRVL